MSRRPKRVKFDFLRVPATDENCPVCGKPMSEHKQIPVAGGIVSLPCTSDCITYQPQPVAPQGDAAYWRERAERAEKIAERLYQAAYCWWVEYKSATFRPSVRVRLLGQLEKALDDYDKGRAEKEENGKNLE